MFAKLFRGCKDESNPNSSSQILKQTLEMLGEKEMVLQKKILTEVQRAKEFTRAKNKQAALQCLKRKKYYEGKIEQLGGLQSRIHDQEQKLPQETPTLCSQVRHSKSDVKSNFSKLI